MNLSALLSNIEKPLLLDGGMGTELAKAGLEMGGHNSATHPDAVLAVHKNYVECGTNLLITNTLTMNRIYIEAHNIGVDVREVNLAGAKLAKEAILDRGYALGDMSSTSKMLKPYGDLEKDDAFTAFKEQAAILAEGGADGFIIETLFDLEEALLAVKACKEVSDLPVLASMTFTTADKGGRTIMGNTAKDCAERLTEAGASAVGTNCGDLTPIQMAEIVAMMKKATSLPIMVQPNAGLPKLIDGKTVFDMSPKEFAKGMEKCIQAGAKIVGGCCGTSPSHIKVLAEMLKK